MKKIYFLLSILTALFCNLKIYGQWYPFDNFIKFDAGDSILNWNSVIYIDTVHYHHNIWQVGKPHKAVFNAAYSAPNAIVTDTLYPYPPNDTSAFILVFPGHSSYVPLANLSFEYKLCTDTTSKAMIEYSPDSGYTWINIFETLPTGFAYITPLTNTTTWNNFYISFIWFMPVLDNNDSLMFKFSFISGNDTTSKDGWIIDDIDVLYYAEGVQSFNNNKYCTIFPNPANNLLTVTAANKITSISITNLLGKIVYSSVGDNEKLEIDVANLQTGMYFIKVNETEVYKFIKQP